MILSLLLLLQVQSLLQPCQSITSPKVRFALNKTSSDILVHNAKVLAYAGRAVHIFNATLSPLDEYSKSNNISGLVSMDDSSEVVCLSNGYCHLQVNLGDYDYGLSLEDDFAHKVRNVALPDAKIAMSRIADTVYIGSSGGAGTSRRKIQISKLQVDHLEYVIRLKGFSTNFITSQHFISRRFFHSFYDGGYVYFLAVDQSRVSSDSGVKIIRMCHMDGSSVNAMEAMFEIKIDCGRLAGNVSIVSFSKIGKMIVLGVSGPGSDKICAFDVAEVNSNLTLAYNQCLAGSLNFTIPWYREVLNCMGFQRTARSECNFGSPNDLHFIRPGVLVSPNSVTSKVLLNLDALDAGVQEFTAAALVQIEGLQYFYIALSGSASRIVKYQLTSGNNSYLRKLSVLDVPSSVSRMKGGSDYLYVATEHEIMGFEVDGCQSFVNCSSCTESVDPGCGWCNLEGKCSHRGSCRRGDLRGRWVQQEGLCLSRSFEFEKKHFALDSLGKLKLVFGSTTASFPEVVQNETYRCACATPDRNWSVPLTHSGLDSFCDLSSGTLSITADEGMGMRISVVADIDGLIDLTMLNPITIHNCSLNLRCSDCERVVACGWCPYKRRCMGTGQLCRHQRSWITREGDNITTTKCPVVLPASGGRYVLPIGVAENMSLITRNIPPPRYDVEYLCKFHYSSGRFVLTSAAYIPHSESSQIACQVKENQVGFSSSVNKNGVEELRLSVWTNGSNGILHEIEQSHIKSDGSYHFSSGDNPQSQSENSPSSDAARMVVYNCSQFSESCSYCTSVNVGSGFNCGWCSSNGREQECIPNSQSCTGSQGTSFVNSSKRCIAYPMIRSVSPISGPAAGGTEVTITGIDMGVSPEEYEIRFGSLVCVINPSRFVPGREVVCTTSSYNTKGNFQIRVKVKRDLMNPIYDVTAIFGDGVQSEFYYGVPTVSDIFPRYGPRSGGSLVTVRGSELGIGNTDLTMVELAGLRCIIQTISSSEIKCLSSGADFVGHGRVQITINDMELSSPPFKYTEDPQFFSVTPKGIIPAGGISLRFVGEFLNVTQHPRIEVYVNNISYSGNCSSNSSRELVCLSPRLPPLMQSSNIRKRSRGGNGGVVLNYTLVLDEAPGPSIANDSLTLYLRDNPVFLDNGRVEYVVYSGESITIQGRNLDFVEQNEIRVTISGEPCVITFISAVELRCKPPDLRIYSYGISIQVDVANGSLRFSVGSMRYQRPSTTTSSLVTPLPPLWMPVITACASLLALVIIICSVGIVCLLCIRRRNRGPSIALSENELNTKMCVETDKTLPRDHEENVYEVIPDYLILSANGRFPVDGNTSSGTAGTTPHLIQIKHEGSYYNSPNPVTTVDSFSSELSEQTPVSIPDTSSSNDDYVKMCSHSVTRASQDIREGTEREHPHFNSNEEGKNIDMPPDGEKSGNNVGQIIEHPSSTTV